MATPTQPWKRSRRSSQFPTPSTPNQQERGDDPSCSDQDLSSPVRSSSVQSPLASENRPPTLGARKSLHYSLSKIWSEIEVKVLVEYVCMKGHTQKWPSFGRHHAFWSNLSNFISYKSAGQVERTRDSCRNKIQRDLQKNFPTPLQAKAHFSYVEMPQGVPKFLLSSTETDTHRLLNTYLQLTEKLGSEEQLDLLSQLFSHYAATNSSFIVPEDFLVLAYKGMKELQDGKRSNVLYSLAKTLGTKRSDGSDSLMPIHRMPMGMIEYCCNFFSATQLEQARVNIPGLSERTLERHIVDSGITLGAEVQIAMLDAAARRSPNARWWMKGDGCDLTEGLKESTHLRWSGDVDLDDGELQREYQHYRETLSFVDDLSPRTTTTCITGLRKCSALLSKDKSFIIDALKKTDEAFRNHMEKSGSQTKAMLKLGWTLEELTKLLDLNQQLITDAESLIEHISADASNNGSVNLSQFKKSLTSFIRDLSRQKRTPASHIFVVMISSELRDTKPYAIPIQCIPYTSIGVSQLRTIVKKVLKLMKNRGMEVIGFTSNGEHNSIRNRGYTRPLSVFRIRSDLRSKYSRMSERALADMLTPTISKMGLVTAIKYHPAVPTLWLTEIFVWKSVLGLTWHEVLVRLRPRTVPNGYKYHHWKKPTKKKPEETDGDIMRAILCQLEFGYTIKKYDNDGVPFRTHLHVPEVHPDTGRLFYEREDPGHVLKRIAQCTRNGGPSTINLEHYLDALKDESACLTYSALVGQRKQSVQDAERMFSKSLEDFFKKDQKYHEEYRYVKAVRGWRRACDERGLNERERSRLNYGLLNYILDDLMPWHSDMYDFSQLEVTRGINDVCGFTRQVLIAVVADIKTYEWRRIELSNLGLPPENPRASTTDDVECFFSVIRDLVGKDFTLQQVKYAWRKVCAEYDKRTDPELPFYYFTSHHDRFYEDERPGFNEPPEKQRRPRHPRREMTSVFASGRASLPVAGSLHTRAQFHSLPVNLPPPPGVNINLAEHSYAGII